MLQMAQKMEAQAEEIERLRMELERNNLKNEEHIPEHSAGALAHFLQEERVSQWMRLCVGALKEWIDKMEVGEQLKRALDHARSDQARGSSPKGPHVGL